MADALSDRGLKSDGEGIEGDDRSVRGRSDAALVAAAARGDRHAFAEVYRRYGPQGYGLARRLCGEDRAKEVIQQVFLEMWEKPHRFDPDRGSLRAFLLMQVHGRSIDRIRSDGSRQAREFSRVLVPETPVAGIEAAVLTRSAGDKLWQLLSALPAGQRDAIVLAYVQGYTYRDVADLLGAPEGTIKSRIRAGLVRLRLALSDEGYQGADCLV